MYVRLTAAGAATVLTLCVLGLGLVGVSHTSAQAPGPQGRVANYIVVFRDGVRNTDSEIDTIERGHNFRSHRRFRSVIQGFSASLTPGQVQQIERLPEVDFVSLDREIHIADSVPIEPGDTAPTGLRRIEAATATTTREASNVNVAVIDTGVDLGHPDLNVVNGTNCVSSGQAQDDNGHGTHVAGTIAARDNGSGVVGVVPATTIYAVKVLNSQGTGTWSSVICGIDWVTANASALNIKVANMSVGGGGSSDDNCGNSNNDALHRAICRSVAAGVTYVVAAGNDSSNLANFVPAAYPEVLTVTAMADSDGVGGALGGSPGCWPGQADDGYASYSNYAVSGTDSSHTIAAPGTCIYSTWVTVQTSGSWWRRTTTYTHTYATISGTSMATPHVAGSVALCFGDGGTSGPCAGMTPAQVVAFMRSNAQTRSSTPGYGFAGDPNNPVSGRYYGYLVANTSTPPEPDFAVEAAPATATVTQGEGTNYTITLTSLNGFDSDVALSVSGAPGGVSASFTSSPVTPTAGGATSTLNVSTTSAATPGSYTLEITGTSGALSHAASVTLDIEAAPVPDFAVAASPASRTVAQGDSTSYSVTLTALNGFNSSVGLSVSGAPAGVSAAFSPSSVTPAPGGASSTLNVSTAASTTPGTYTLTITGTSGSLVRDTTVTLTVLQRDFSISASPASRTVIQGGSTSYSVSLASINGFSSPVGLSVSGAPSGVTASVSPSSVTPTGSATLNVSTTGAAAPGSYPLTITGTSGSLVHGTTVTLVVQAVPQGDFTISVSPSSRTLIRFFGMTTTTYTLTLQSSDGYSAPVTLSVSGLGSGFTSSFSPSSLTPTSGGANSTLTVTVGGSASRGSRTFTITGVGSDGTTHSVTASLYVY